MRGGVGTSLLLAIVGFAVLAGVGQSEARSGPDGLARIVFGSGGRIFTIEADGSDREQLTGGPKPRRNNGDFSPAWSPDGSAIAFVRVHPVPGGDAEARTMVMEADGSDPRALTAANDDVYDVDASWSPYGERLAVTRLAERRGRAVSSIVLISLDGGNKETIVRERISRSNPAYMLETAWAPDGQSLVFTRFALRQGRVERSLWSVGIDGTHRRLLQRNASSAAFSPDGSAIAFASTRDRNGKICGSDECWLNGEIYVMDADGTNPVRLTHNQGDDASPDWSGNGQRIVFSSNRNSRARFDAGELYSIDPSGDCLTWLTNGAPASFAPDWEPDPNGSTDPGGCGATPRPPLVETDLTRAGSVDDHSLFWLGPTFDSLLFSDLESYGKTLFLGYFDCGAYDQRDCGPEVQFDEESTCSGEPTILTEARSGKFLSRRGALLRYGGDGLTAYTGRTRITIFLGLGGGEPGTGLDGLVQVVRGLRRLSQSDPAGDLPRPAFSREVLRKARRALALYEDLGSVAAVADAIGISPAAARARIRVARVVERFGPVRSVTCP